MIKIKPFNIEYEGFIENLDKEISIDENTITLVCGESGSGKSVFIKEISKQDDIKDRIYFSHTNSYPPLNYRVDEVLSFLSFPFENYDEFIEYLSKYFNIKDFLKKKLKNLSGGEKSFVALIAALFSKKDIIVLDEPLNMISEEFRNQAVDLINDIRAYKTIIIVSHFIELFENHCSLKITVSNGSFSFVRNDKSIEIKDMKNNSAHRFKRI